jgi:hypothetical protein
MPSLRVAANEQHQFNLRQLIEQPRSPTPRALRPRRQIATLRILTGIAETHGDDRHPANVIELVVRDTHPGAQPLTGWIGEWHSGSMHPRSRGLTYDREPRGLAHPKDRPRRVRQRLAVGLFNADPASANFGEKTVEA